MSDNPEAAAVLSQVVSLLEKVLERPGSRVKLHITASALGELTLEEDGALHLLRQKETTLDINLHAVDNIGKELLLALVGHSSNMKVIESFDWRRR